ncbi:trypsin-like peptidase domain-containing protein [Halosquirtibacter xylanolyticus]|uniref:trypsin-like peptidase domain-containing protein n=1 Tax=Halosquirtibacter xylanolyticus TaxID=3374599 RepID=UPI003747F462|nr:trypsin-like peptidase domain-containing protein [Prolixibacteraceae bacterium]
MRNLYVILSTLLFVGVLTSSIQVKAQQIPYSKWKKIFSVNSVPSINTYVLPSQDNSALKQKYPQTRNKRLQVASPIFVEWDFIQKASRLEFDDKSTAYLLRVLSKDAYFLSMNFSKMFIPSGMKLYVYGSQTKQYLPIQSGMENVLGGYQTNIYDGDTLFIELNIPQDVKTQANLQVSCFNHGFRLFGQRTRNQRQRKGFGDSGSCELDINCSTNTEYLMLKRSVCRLIISGRYLCTGTLMNSNRADKPPYVLTANHCIGSEEEAATTHFHFNYESFPCDGLEGNQSQIVNGSVLRATAVDLDFTLVEMNESPALEYNPYYAGWDVSGEVTEEVYGIHHPEGDVKKYSVSNAIPELASYGEELVPNSSLWIKRWDQGVTEGGSSGSALFDNGKVVGSLIGGIASCINPRNDFYSSLSYIWDYHHQQSMQIKYWLSNNYGVLSMAGYDPQDGMPTKYETQTNVTSDASFSGLIPDDIIFDAVAERFQRDRGGSLTQVSIAMYHGELWTSYMDKTLTIAVYGAHPNDGGLSSLIQSYSTSTNIFKRQNKVFLSLPEPLQVGKDHYIVLSLNDGPWTDDFIPYHSLNEKDVSNTAYFIIDEEMNPMNSYPINQSASFFIGEVIEKDVPTTIAGNKIGQDKVLLYAKPNLGANKYFLYTGEPMKDIVLTVYDINGQLVSTQSVDVLVDGADVDIDNLDVGVYFYTFYHNAKQFKGKFRSNQ